MLSLTEEAAAKSPHTDIEPIQAVASFQSSSHVGALALCHKGLDGQHQSGMCAG